VDTAYGYANIGGWVASAAGTSVDRSPPVVEASITRDINGQPLGEGTGILAEETVTFTVSADPAGDDYSGVNESGIVYWLTSLADGSVEEYWVGCGGEKTCCNITAGPWGPDEYNISFRGYARDRAGNLGYSEELNFAVLGPLGLVTAISDIMLTLGSYEYVPVRVVNRQDVGEHISMKLLDYAFSELSYSGEREASLDRRKLNITLGPLETKLVHILVYTSDICDDCELTLFATSTIHGDVSALLEIPVNVVFPVEFPGLSWPAVLITLALACVLFFRYGKPG
jgi:hypothetical protein